MGGREEMELTHSYQFSISQSIAVAQLLPRSWDVSRRCLYILPWLAHHVLGKIILMHIDK